MSFLFTMIAGRRVPVGGECAQEMVESDIFTQWKLRLDPRFIVESIAVQSVDFVMRECVETMLFAKFAVVFRDMSGKQHVSVVFLRGGSVIFLFVLMCGGKKYAVTVTEQRFPAGEYESVGLPAGMLDGSVDYKAVAAKELQEETHIAIDAEQLVDMTAMFYGGAMRGVDVSRGGSDEFYRCFFASTEVTSAQLRDIDGRIAGAEQENEKTRVGVVPLKQLLKVSPQASTWIAYGLYRELGL